MGYTSSKIRTPVLLSSGILGTIERCIDEGLAPGTIAHKAIIAACYVWCDTRFTNDNERRLWILRDQPCLVDYLFAGQTTQGLLTIPRSHPVPLVDALYEDIIAPVTEVITEAALPELADSPCLAGYCSAREREAAVKRAVMDGVIERFNLGLRDIAVQVIEGVVPRPTAEEDASPGDDVGPEPPHVFFVAARQPPHDHLSVACARDEPGEANSSETTAAC